MKEKDGQKQESNGRRNLGGYFESGLVLLGTIGGLAAASVPDWRVCIPGGLMAAASTFWALERWSRKDELEKMKGR